MIHNLKRPCNDCPFRKNALPGWTGDATPEEFIDTTLADHPMPCHQTVDYTDPDWKKSLGTDEVSYCAGALIMFSNMCKLSRDRKRPRMDKSDDVFTWRQEFLTYHHSMDTAVKEPEE